MGPNNLCTSLFIFSLCPHVTFYKTLTSLSTVFIKGHGFVVELLKWPCRTSFFTNVEPFGGLFLTKSLSVVVTSCLYVE